MSFSGRRAIVTGASSGIGAAVVQQLLSDGATVLAADVDAQGLRRCDTAGAECLKCDVTSSRDRLRLLDTAGEVHYLVNCAGVIRGVPLAGATEQLWDLTLAVNAKATFFLMQALSARMEEGSAIVNVSSTAGKAADTPEIATYSAAKAAVIAMTKTFAHALAPSVRVNCVCPGIIATPMQGRIASELAALRGTDPDGLDEGRLADVPLRRRGTAEEVAAVICFLLSGAAAYITGQALNVSGGRVMY